MFRAALTSRSVTRPQPPQASSRTPKDRLPVPAGMAVRARVLGTNPHHFPTGTLSLAGQLLHEPSPLLFGDRPRQHRMPHHVRDLEVLDGDPVVAFHDACRNLVERVALPHPCPLPRAPDGLHLPAAGRGALLGARDGALRLKNYAQRLDRVRNGSVLSSIQSHPTCFNSCGCRRDLSTRRCVFRCVARGMRYRSFVRTRSLRRCWAVSAMLRRVVCLPDGGLELPKTLGLTRNVRTLSTHWVRRMRHFWGASVGFRKPLC